LGGEKSIINYKICFCVHLYVFAQTNACALTAKLSLTSWNIHTCSERSDARQWKYTHTHTHTHTLKWYNWSYIVNKSLSINLWIFIQSIYSIFWQLKLRRPLRHCVFWLPVCCNVRNKSHNTCRKWYFWFLRAVKSEKRSGFRLFMMPCSSGQRSVFWTCVLPSHRDVGWMISQLHVKKTSNIHKCDILYTS